MPITGIVRAVADAASTTTTFTDAPSSAVASADGNCVMGDVAGTAPTDTYNRTLTTGGSTPACIMRFRFN
jgi:hypothetical protein